MEHETLNQPKKRLAVPLIVALLFVGPLAVAWFMYFIADDWRPQSRLNHGELLDPPVTLPEVSLSSSAEGVSESDLVRGSWSIILVSDGICQQPCRRALHNMRQVRLALGKNAHRVQRLFLYLGEQPDPGFIAREHRGLVLAALGHPDAQPLLGAFRGLRDSQSLVGLYVSDPLGNLVLRYPLQVAPRGLLEDLKRLLRYSRVG